MWSPTHVQIIVQRARNVIAKGKNGTNDAYVIIQNGKEKFQTSIKEQSVDPVWHEECDLLLENKETDIIKLIVFHRNLFGLADEFLGQAFIPLKDFDIYERPKSRWYSLESRSSKKSAKPRGEIEVRITFIVKTNEKIKKKTGVHQSLLDIRDTLRNDSNKSHADKSDTKNTIPRKFSMSAYNKVPKLATRSLSFKLESFNSRRKSLVEKFRRRHDSVCYESETEQQQSKHMEVQNEQIAEEISKSQEEVSISDSGIEVTSDNILKIQIKNQTINKVENTIKPEINNSLQTKSSWFKLSNGALKRTLSSSNVLLTSSPIKPNRERSSTLTSAQEISEKLPQFHARDLRLCKNDENTINNPSSKLKENILRQSLNKESLINAKLKAIKNFERRHTIDINQMVPNHMHSSIASEKRATQASPDSLYSSFESLVNKKPSKTDYHQKYESLNKEELIQLIETQQLTIIGLNEQINNLEEYIDNLLVRVIENSPRILQSPYKFKSILQI